MSDLNYDTIKVLNGSHSDSGYATILNDPKLSWLYSQIKGFGLNHLEEEVFNYSAEGFEKFVVIVYRQLVNWISSNWEYSESFIEALQEQSDGIDKFGVDIRLIQNGTMALVNLAGGYYLVPYNSLENDIYDHPMKIRTQLPNYPNSTWNQREFESADFVIMDNDPTQWNILIKTIPFAQIMYRSLCQIWEGQFNSSTHWLILQDDSYDMDFTQNGVAALNDLVNGRHKMIAFSPKRDDNDANGTGNSTLDAAIFQKFKDGLVALKQENLLDTFWNSYYNSWNELKSVLGMSVNTNVKKAERQITSEITQQQDLPLANRNAYFEKRKHALKMANKKWGTNWDITLKEPEGTLENNQIEQGDDENDGNIEKD